MSERDDCGDTDSTEPVVAPGKARYEAPKIVWTEPYQPMAFGVSCAKQPGNPPCNSGPVSS